jgi:hypothetical protein
MAYPSVTYIFANDTVADASEVNSNFTDILNGFSDGTKDLNMNAGTFAGAVICNANVTIGNATSDDLTVTSRLASDLIPKTTNIYDLGSSSLYYAEGYINKLCVGGTSSHALTITESSSTSQLALIRTGTATGGVRLVTVNGGLIVGTGYDTYMAGGATAMTIDDSANVCIGTASPLSALHIYKDVPTIRLTDTNSTDRATATALIDAWDRDVNNLGIIGWGSEHLFISNYCTNGNLVFATNTDTRMVIDSNGDITCAKSLSITQDLIVNTDTLFVDQSANRVGIGTDTPDSKVEISTGTGNTLKLSNTNVDGDTTLVFEDTNDTTANFTMGTDGSEDAFKIAYGSSGDLTTNTRMTIDSSGNVGINTSSPDSALQVNGAINGNINAKINELVRSIPFNPTTWETGPQGSGSGAFQGGVLLPNGKVFAIPRSYTGTNTIYNPATNAWETGPQGPGSGAFLGGVLLPNGKVFAIPFNYTGTDTIYNPVSNAWETGPAGPGSSAFVGGVLLPNGKVFAIPYNYTGTNTIYSPGVTGWPFGDWMLHSFFNKL